MLQFLNSQVFRILFAYFQTREAFKIRHQIASDLELWSRKQEEIGQLKSLLSGHFPTMKSQDTLKKKVKSPIKH